jgi:hypothetical protein
MPPFAFKAAPGDKCLCDMLLVELAGFVHEQENHKIPQFTALANGHSGRRDGRH